MEPSVRVRFAPSPTGYLHIGGLRTALYNELFAKKMGGTFILRIEDTDRSRLVEEQIAGLCRSLELCGVIPTEGIWLDRKGELVHRGDYGPYLQSERKDKHLAYAKQLIDLDKAYHCFCTTERLELLRKEQEVMKKPTMYDGLCRSVPREQAEKRIAAGESYVIRLKLPRQGKVSFTDMIRGPIEFEWALIDDQVIIKSDGFPTYHLAATCDDHDMAISHTIRGDDWTSSTPKHLFIFESFGWTPPQYAHLPLLLNADRSKLSKRNGDVAVEDFLAKGYLPEALINFVALLGWNPTADREVYTQEELGSLFDLSKVNKAGAVFNREKLDWFNAHYIKTIPEERYLNLTHPFVEDKSTDQSFIDRCLLLVRDRVVLPKDVTDLTGFFFLEHFEFSSAKPTWKVQTPAEAIERLAAVRELVASWPETAFVRPTGRQQFETEIKALIAAKGWGNGDTLWPLRVTLSGQEKSPTPFDLLETYGKERSLARLDQALAFLKKI